MKVLFEHWRKFIDESKEKKKDASEKEIETAARKFIDAEGGAIGRKMLKDPKKLKAFLADNVDIPEDFDLGAFIDEFIKGSKDIGVHDKKDIIAGDGKQVKITKEDIAEGLEIFLEEQEDPQDNNLFVTNLLLELEQWGFLIKVVKLKMMFVQDLQEKVRVLQGLYNGTRNYQKKSFNNSKS